MRPATWAKPLSEARNTAVASASPVASRIGTRCTASAPNTTAVAAPIKPNSTMPMVRAAPSSGGSAGAAAAGGGCIRRDDIRVPARQPEPVQRQATQRLMAANTRSVVRQPIAGIELVADGPEHGRGKAAEQCQVGDGAAPARGRHLHECGKRRVVEVHAHGETQERPRGQVGIEVVTCDSATRPTAVRMEPTDMTSRPPRRIDQAADRGRDGARHQQRDGEAAEHQALAPAGIGGDRLAEHAQRIKRRAPGDDLREPQRHDGVGGGIAHERAPAEAAPGLSLPHFGPPGAAPSHTAVIQGLVPAYPGLPQPAERAARWIPATNAGMTTASAFAHAPRPLDAVDPPPDIPGARRALH